MRIADLRIKTFIILLISTVLVSCNDKTIENIENGSIRPEFDYFYAITSTGYCGYFIDFGLSEVDATGWSTYLSIESSFPLSEIRVVSSESWLNCEKIEDGYYKLSVDGNDSEWSRHGYIDFFPGSTDVFNNSGDQFSIGVFVSQGSRKINMYYDGKNFPSGSSLYFDGNGGNSSILEVRADGDYSIIEDPDESWFSITQQDTNKFIVNAESNPLSISREGLIKIVLSEILESDKNQVEIKVVQSKGRDAEFLYTPGVSNGWSFESGWLGTEDYSYYYGLCYLCDEFKITDSPSWTGGIWGNGGEGMLSSDNGSYNIKVPEEGLYWLEVNLIEERYSMNKVKSIKIMRELSSQDGSFDEHSMSSDNYLEWIGWLMLKKDDRINFRVNFDNYQYVNLGGQAGELRKDGAYLAVEEDGYYRITINFTTLPYTYTL